MAVQVSCQSPVLSRDEFEPSSSWLLEPGGLDTPIAVQPQGKERSLGRRRVTVISFYLLALGWGKKHERLSQKLSGGSRCWDKGGFPNWQKLVISEEKPRPGSPTSQP